MTIDPAILITDIGCAAGAYTAKALLDKGYTNISGICNDEPLHPIIKPIKNRLTIFNGDPFDYYFVTSSLDQSEIVVQTISLQDHHIYKDQGVFESYRNTIRMWIDIALAKQLVGFIHVSPAWIPYIPGQINPIHENTTWQPNAIQHKCHQGLFYSELEVHRGIAEGLNASILSTGQILGIEPDGFGIQKIIQWIQKEKFYPTGTGSYVFAGDVAIAVVSIIESQVWKEKFFLSAGSINHKEVYEQLAKSHGVLSPLKPLTKTKLNWNRLIQKLRRIFVKKDSDIPTAWYQLQQAQIHMINDKSLEYHLVKYTPVLQSIDQLGSEY